MSGSTGGHCNMSGSTGDTVMYPGLLGWNCVAHIIMLHAQNSKKL